MELWLGIEASVRELESLLELGGLQAGLRLCACLRWFLPPVVRACGDSSSMIRACGGSSLWCVLVAFVR